MANLNYMEDVLTTYCSDHIKQMYTTLDKEAKAKLLLALKSLLEMRQQMDMMDSFSQMKSSSGPNATKQRDQDPLLTRAFKSIGTNKMMQDYSHLKLMLKSWGARIPRYQAIMKHHQNVAHFKALDQMATNDANAYLRSTTQVVTKGGASSADFTSLKKIFIRDLKVFQTSTGKYLEGKIITPPSISTGLYTYLEDGNGEYVQLAIYNMITTGPLKWEVAEQKFAVGTKLKISQPFYKVFADGNLGIRVDSPSEIYRETPDSHLSIDEIRNSGKEFMKAGEYFEALEIYLEGVKSSQIEALLNNRSQTEIKLEQYEEALLDAASVLLFSNNAKANNRYNIAADKLCLKMEDKAGIFAVWKHILKHQQTGHHNLPAFGSKEKGNEAFKHGNYEEAKRIYSAALRDSESCILLNNVAVVCLKLEMFHTAISAATACLRLTTQTQIRGKAHYSMAKAFALLGEIELSKLSAEYDPTLDGFWKDEMKKMLKDVSAPTSTAYKEEKSDNPLQTWDFVKTEAIQHNYIAGRGRGLEAKQKIGLNELLLLDHPIVMEGVKFSSSHELFLASNRTGTMDTHSHLNLVTKILALVKYDGLLGKKLLCLETRGNLNEERLPLIDLDWMAYRKFSYDVPPFLPQTPQVVGCDWTKLTEPFISQVVDINIFGRASEGESVFEHGVNLCLRISLVNHDRNPNCVVVGYSDATALVSRRVIKKGEELTVSYGDVQTNNKWGI